jgi:hypothetical protein
MSHPIYIELSVECADAVGLARLGRRWLVEGVTQCASDLMEELKAQPEQPPYGQRFRPVVSNGVVGLLRVDPRFTMGSAGIRSYTEATWQWFVEQVDAGEYFLAEIHLARLDSRCAMIEPYVHLRIEKLPDLDGWVHVVLQTGKDWLYANSTFRERCVDLAFGVAGEFDATFGNWTDDIAYRSSYEAELPTLTYLTLPKSREFLRGYSWLTVVPPEIAKRLGGAAGLEATGQFVSVRPLVNGGVGLIACERPEDFTSETAERLEQVFRSVLIPGP